MGKSVHTHRRVIPRIAPAHFHTISQPCCRAQLGSDCTPWGTMEPGLVLFGRWNKIAS